MSFINTTQFIRTHRTLFLWGYGGVCLIVIILAVSGVATQSWGLLPIAMALILLLACRLFLVIWVTRYRLDNKFTSIRHLLRQHQLPDPNKHVAYLDLGYRYDVNNLAIQMVRGRFHLIDLYAPHLTPASHLQRVRQELDPLPNDLPTMEFAVGTVDLLPLPDDSVHLVVLPFVWKEILQEGDRKLLLNEITRILEPSGRLLLLEQHRSYLNWMCVGFPTFAMIRKSSLRASFSNSSLSVVDEQSPLQLFTAVVAQKQGAQLAHQLPLSLYD